MCASVRHGQKNSYIGPVVDLTYLRGEKEEGMILHQAEIHSIYLEKNLEAYIFTRPKNEQKGRLDTQNLNTFF